MVTNYKETLNLPQTDFPMKANLALREPAVVEEWEAKRLYHRMIETRKDRPRYVFHDGPPYANGHLHLGTMLNKILKDIVVKYKNMSGYRCDFVPGWDCHGLPIELDVDKQLGAKKASTSPLEVRLACRVHAEKFVAIQRNEFKRLGCFGRWEKPYLTMSHAYEATIAREFGKFVANGGVYRGKKPIYWCSSCRTALAEAEVEYADRTSPSIYVKFRLKDDGEFRHRWALGNESISLLIWTTTPWTIPANLGIALHPDFSYAAVNAGGEVFILAEELVEKVMGEIGAKDWKVVGTCKASELERKHCQHPLIDRLSLIVLGDHVTLEAGTGAVHTAPGHGQEDYEVGHRYHLDIFSPVDDRGRFTAEVQLDWLVGVAIEKTNEPIMEKLGMVGALVSKGTIAHSYPHCWRCKRPVIFRSTEQWFISMASGALRCTAMIAIDKVEWIPPWGKKRIGGMIEHRPDWCISRQRVWGVPIVAMACGSCGKVQTTPELIEHAAGIFERESSDAWFSKSTESFLPKKFSCAACGETKRFVKEHDILDVWFDSGVSYAAVLEEQEGIKEPADLYLEGSDQHRGWFHTSLLTSIGTRGRAPYKRVLTHGFVVDGEGRKYSKSAKNYVPPEQLLSKYGAEIIRMWVAAEDYRDDIRFSDEIVSRIAESYRKIRNTCRYLVGNLYDFDPEHDAVSQEKLVELDRWALSELARLIERVRHAYEEFEFHTVYHLLNRFCTVELSAFYLDILKDRLYAEAKVGELRRSAQTVLWNILDTLVRLSAPILSFTSDELWTYLPKAKGMPESVFLADMPEKGTLRFDEHLATRWERLMVVRSAVTKVLETARAEKAIGNSLEAKVVLDGPDELCAFLKDFGDGLADLFIVSGAERGKTQGDHMLARQTVDGLTVAVFPADGTKCARCWKYAKSVGRNTEHPELCLRCVSVVKG